MKDLHAAELAQLTKEHESKMKEAQLQYTLDRDKEREALVQSHQDELKKREEELQSQIKAHQEEIKKMKEEYANAVEDTHRTSQVNASVYIQSMDD